jgi:hypothetical protein
MPTPRDTIIRYEMPPRNTFEPFPFAHRSRTDELLRHQSRHTRPDPNITFAERHPTAF